MVPLFLNGCLCSEGCGLQPVHISRSMSRALAPEALPFPLLQVCQQSEQAPLSEACCSEQMALGEPALLVISIDAHAALRAHEDHASPGRGTRPDDRQGVPHAPAGAHDSPCDNPGDGLHAHRSDQDRGTTGQRR